MFQVLTMWLPRLPLFVNVKLSPIDSLPIPYIVCVFCNFKFKDKSPNAVIIVNNK